MTRILTAGWMVVLAGSVSYLATTLLCFSMAKFPPRSPASDDNAEMFPSVESWRFKNPEVDEMVLELKREREEFALREQQLLDLEARITNERQEIGVVTQAIWRMRGELERTLVRLKQEEIPNLKKLAKVHAAMSPEGSANLLKEQNDEEVLKILFFLKPAESGPILEALGRPGKADAARAAQLTERLRRTIEPQPQR